MAYNAVVNNSHIRPGDRVLVLGPGTIGMLCAIIAKLNGAQVALAGLERDDPRLKIARGYDIHTITGDATDWCKYAPGSDGFGCEGVIDATGVSIALKAALELVRPNGWITKVGWGPQPLNFSLDPLVQKNVRLQGSFSHHWPIWERIIALMASGQLHVAPLIGGMWPLQEWREAFETMQSGKIVKAVLKPGE